MPSMSRARKRPNYGIPIQRIVLENRRYGYRRVAAELRQQGREVNHKRVLRLMREDNLLCLQSGALSLRRIRATPTGSFRI